MAFPPNGFPPPQPSDIFDLAGRFLGNSPQQSDGFNVANIPTTSGLGTRQSRLPNNRVGSNTRHLIHWLIPEGPIVQMYINPQNISYDDKKAIIPQRTKGGFVIQYWGEELTSLNLSGTTGTSGIEGINVLHDIYRNEQLAFDPFALYVAAKGNQDFSVAGVGSAIGSAIGGALGGEIGGAVGTLLGGSQNPPQQVSQPPSLAQLACTVEMYYAGIVYRGFFTSFSVKESADQLGLFNYDINFTSTQRRGFRSNFLAWHRSATNGPSNSDPINGTPYSYSSLSSDGIATPQRTSNQTNLEDIPDIIAESIGLGIF